MSSMTRMVLETWGMCGMRGDCLLVGSDLYLVTTEHYYQKPTYESVTEALEEMKKMCERNSIEKIVLPKVDSNSTRLLWFRVRRILMQMFADTDIHVLVCER